MCIQFLIPESHCPQTVQHGFPHRASALAWDPLLRLAALGTATGALKVYGRPGVELYGQHTNPDSAVTQIHFIPGMIHFAIVPPALAW